MFDHCSFFALGRISQIKHFDKVTRVNLAVSADYERDGKWVEKTNFLEFVIFSPAQVEKVKMKFAVGEWARIEGTVQPNQYEKDGKTIYGTDLVVSSIYRLPAKLKNAEGAS